MAIPSDKDMLFEKVQGIFQQSGNIRVFEKLLSQHNIKTYYRNNKLTGVYYGKRKYRFKHSLGIDISLLLLKDKTKERLTSLKELQQRKSLNKSKDKER
ncbi:MAG: hypothetical protein AAF611_07725 [Bacteroidota bacterium]